MIKASVFFRLEVHIVDFSCLGKADRRGCKFANPGSIRYSDRLLL